MQQELQSLIFFRLKNERPKELAKKLHWYIKKRTSTSLEEKQKLIKAISKGMGVDKK